MGGTPIGVLSFRSSILNLSHQRVRKVYPLLNSFLNFLLIRVICRLTMIYPMSTCFPLPRIILGMAAFLPICEPIILLLLLIMILDDLYDTKLPVIFSLVMTFIFTVSIMSSVVVSYMLKLSKSLIPVIAALVVATSPFLDSTKKFIGTGYIWHSLFCDYIVAVKH